MHTKYRVKDIIKEVEQLAPLSLAEPWDNPGLQVGSMEQEIRAVFLCLDVTKANVNHASQFGASLILSHHPLLFAPPKQIVTEEVTGCILSALLQQGISVYSAHTNLDHADGGMNDALAQALQLTQVRRFREEECRDGLGNPIDNIGRVGDLNLPMTMAEFTALTKKALDCRSLRYLGNPDRAIRKVALCSGAGGDGIYSAYHAGADLYVTSDIRHHEAQLASELGLNLIDAGHFETENLFVTFMKKFLEERLPGLEVYVSPEKPYFES